MPRVTEAHKASRRDQILDAALDRFVDQGFHETSMADIFESAGLSAGAVYSYFPGKRDIVVAVARRALGAQVDGIVGSTPSGEVPPPATVIGGIHAALAAQRIPTALIVQLWGEATVDEDFHGLIVEVFGMLRAAFGTYLARWARQSRGLSEADATAWAADTMPILLALGQGLIAQSALLPEFDLERYLVGVERVLG